MKRRKVNTADSVAERIDTGDAFEVVYDSNFEQPVIEIKNTVWVEEPRYIAFVGPEPKRQIRDLIAALEALLAD